MQRLNLGLTALLFGLTMTSSAVAQFETVATSRNLPWMYTGELWVVIPRSNEALVVYSIGQDKWVRIPTPGEPDDEVHPVISGHMLAMQKGRTVFGYSAKHGVWDQFELPDEEAAPLEVSDDHIRLQTDDKLYLFSINAGKWTGIDLATGAFLELKPQNASPERKE